MQIILEAWRLPTGKACMLPVRIFNLYHCYDKACNVSLARPTEFSYTNGLLQENMGLIMEEVRVHLA